MEHKRGFTMVELAIVMVVIGLIMGGILVGQSLIHSAKLRAVTRSVEQFEASVGAFKDKYLGLPGDLAEATKYWGTDPNGCPSNTVQTPRRETCNGNGDGHVGNYDYDDIDDMAEAFRAIQQLSNAGLISGEYSGVSGTGGTGASHAIAGVNTPKAKFSDAGWSYYYIEAAAASGLKTPTANVWEIGNQGDDNGMGDGPVMTQVDAQSIDAKVDDGMPNTGNVRAYFVGVCIADTDPATAYVTTVEDENRCALEFISGF